MKLKAYAKINLGLKVKKRRTDKYHDLEMVMVNIDLYDTIIMKKSKTIEFFMDSDICPKEENIAYKAIILMKKRYEVVTKGVSVEIYKKIPAGSGLGGGSSDAGAVIRGLNKLWKLNLSIYEMERVAFLLGADVPFFIRNHLSIVKGAGEDVFPIAREGEYGILVTVPETRFSTRDIFRNLVDVEDDKRFFNIVNGFPVSDNIFNDLELAVKKFDPKFPLQEIKDALVEAGCLNACMSGSGSSIYGICKLSKLDSIAHKFKKNNPEYKIIKTKILIQIEGNLIEKIMW